MENCNYEFICCRYTFPNTTRKAGQFGAPEGKFCNTPLVTIQSTFDFMKTYSQRLTPKPTFLIMGGDFHGHDMDLQTKASTLQKLNEFTEFAEGMKSGMKVFPTIGNHDGFPCDQLDYRPGNDMFNEYSKIWAKHRFTSESISNIRKGAYYTELIIPGLRIITMNTQIFSRTNYYVIRTKFKNF
jgi:sphingomyelin phosphodiesterase